jgi:hypothetical protein
VTPAAAPNIVRIVIEASAPVPVRPKRCPIAAVLGVLSVVLLGASLQWAHHWGPLADAIVIGWAVATLGSLVVSIQFFRDKLIWSTHGWRRLAKIGLAGGIISVIALVLAGAVWAAGINPTGACGGG